jgi:trigger factor
MASVMERKENNVVSLTIDVSPEAFADALQRAFNKNRNKFSVPGFRKGKAPMQIVTKYYGEGVLYDDAIDFASSPAYVAALEEHDLEPVSRPEMDIIEISRETGLKFSVEITVKPEVTLGQYKGVEAVMPEVSVSDEDVERELKSVQDRNARQVPVEDRPVAEGDTANIDYEGFLNEVPFEGGKGADYDLKIGSGTFIPGFEDQLIGKNAGDEFEINVTFPEDYGSEELKGQAVIFKVKINSIKVRELPELDDEFAKDVSEFDTLAEYKDSLRKKLEENAQHRADGTFEDNVVKAVAANASVDIPEVMIEREVDQMVQEQSQQMRYQGIELEQYLGYIGQTMDSFKEQLHESAQKRILMSLVIEAVAKAEKIEAGDDEVEAEIDRLAGMYQMKAEDLKTRMMGDDNNFVKENVIRQKAVELMKASAVKIAAPEEPEAEADAEVDQTTGQTEVSESEASE